MSSPRPIRGVHRGEGWTPETDRRACLAGVEGGGDAAGSEWRGVHLGSGVMALNGHSRDSPCTRIRPSAHRVENPLQVAGHAHDHGGVVEIEHGHVGCDLIGDFCVERLAFAEIGGEARLIEPGVDVLVGIMGGCSAGRCWPGRCRDCRRGRRGRTSRWRCLGSRRGFRPAGRWRIRRLRPSRQSLLPRPSTG